MPALEFYFQINSIEASCETLAAMAATLANSGTCPVSRKYVLPSPMLMMMMMMRLTLILRAIKIGG